MKEIDLLDNKIKQLNEEKIELNERIYKIKDEIELYNSIRDKLILGSNKNELIKMKKDGDAFVFASFDECNKDILSKCLDDPTLLIKVLVLDSIVYKNNLFETITKTYYKKLINEPANCYNFYSKMCVKVSNVHTSYDEDLYDNGIGLQFQISIQKGTDKITRLNIVAVPYDYRYRCCIKDDKEHYEERCKYIAKDIIDNIKEINLRIDKEILNRYIEIYYSGERDAQN